MCFSGPSKLKCATRRPPHSSSGKVQCSVTFLAHQPLPSLIQERLFGGNPIIGYIKLSISEFVRQINSTSTGLTGHRTIQKLVSTTLFLYFACILPSIAFGVLNSRNTKGQIGKFEIFQMFLLN